MTAGIPIQTERAMADLKALSCFNENAGPGITRVLFTKTDMDARAWMKDRMRDAGLKVREDAVGNIFARLEGTNPALPAIGTGSHNDAIPHSGMYDGTVGVIGGLEALRAIAESGIRPLRSIELLAFTAEEPTRYGIGCLGSRLLAGTLGEDADLMKDKDGIALKTTRESVGYTGSLSSVRLSKDYYAAFVELHIEQGPILEQEGLMIGAVTAIAAPASFRVTFKGSGGHAGTVLMPNRRDALPAAAELALAVEEIASNTGSPDTVGTVGVFKPYPGAINSIPSECMLEIDVRDIQEESRDMAVGSIQLTAEEIAMRRGLELKFDVLNSDPPLICDEVIVEAVRSSCIEAGVTHRDMISRAYHDSLFMGRVAPTGMIFIPCRDGVSHRPDEYTSPDQFAAGMDVLARVLFKLANRPTT